MTAASLEVAIAARRGIPDIEQEYDSPQLGIECDAIAIDPLPDGGPRRSPIYVQQKFNLPIFFFGTPWPPCRTIGGPPAMARSIVLNRNRRAVALVAGLRRARKSIPPVLFSMFARPSRYVTFSPDGAPEIRMYPLKQTRRPRFRPHRHPMPCETWRFPTGRR